MIDGDREKIKRFAKKIEFDLPNGDFRDAAVEHMRKQSAIEWVCAKDFGVTEKWQNWGINLSFIKGQKYTGIPYADTKVSYDQFVEGLDGGEYTCELHSWKDVYGVQCVSSVMNSMQQFAPTVCGYSGELMPGWDRFCGIALAFDYPSDGAERTADIIKANGDKGMCEAYALLKKGDVILTKDSVRDMSHVRMIVESPVTVRNDDGLIDPVKSTVKCIEQTSDFDRSRTVFSIGTCLYG